MKQVSFSIVKLARSSHRCMPFSGHILTLFAVTEAHIGSPCRSTAAHGLWLFALKEKSRRSGEASDWERLRWRKLWLAIAARRLHRCAMAEDTRLISIHLPKSGGTSVRGSLERQFGDRALFDYGRGPLGPDRDLVEPGLPPGIDLVHGHFRPGRYDAVQSAFRFTFLRQPVDLLLSFYFFWRTMPDQGQALHRRFLDEQPTLEAFATWGPIQKLSSDTFFGGYDMERFDFIGFHETRASDMMRLNDITGLQLEPGRHDNATQHGDEERATVRSDVRRMAALTDLVVDDVRFYDAQRARRG